MISALTGRLAVKAPTHVTVDVHGVGYEVHIPLSTYYALPDVPQETSLRIHTHLREDALQLYGFLTLEEKEAFVLLTSVSGIGPKLALSVLSALSVPDLASAVRSGNVEKLATVPGVGKKFAGRLVLELREKVDRVLPEVPAGPGPTADPRDRVVEDARSALVNLGYRPAPVTQALERVARSAAEPHVLEELIRRTLKELAKGGGG